MNLTKNILPHHYENDKKKMPPVVFNICNIMILMECTQTVYIAYTSNTVNIVVKCDKYNIYPETGYHVI